MDCGDVLFGEVALEDAPNVAGPGNDNLNI